MLHIDSATVGLVYTVLSLGMAIFVAIASQQAGGGRGFAEWTLASISLAIGVTLNVLQEHLPLGFVIGTSNFLFMLGWGYQFRAIGTFFGRRYPPAPFWMMAIAHAVLMAYFAAALQSVPLRLFWYNSMAMLAAIAIMYQLWRPASGALRTAVHTTCALFGLLALLHGTRLIWFMLLGTPDSVMGPSPIQSLVGIGICLMQIGASFGFLLMQNVRLTDELRAQADLDGLTGLFNRRGLNLHAQRLLERARAGNAPLALLMIDIDHFKQINDTHGHLSGDEVLRELSSRLPLLLRPTDMLGRFGGEEFLALLPNAGHENALTIAERIRSSIHAQPFAVQGQPVHLSLSIGIAMADDVGHDLHRCIDRADAALYYAKKNGRNRTHYQPPPAVAAT